MNNFDVITNTNNKIHCFKLRQTPDHSSGIYEYLCDSVRLFKLYWAKMCN